jgi:hypothetical protein
MFGWLQRLQERAHERGRELRCLSLPPDVFVALVMDLRLHYHVLDHALVSGLVFIQGPFCQTKVVADV